MSSKGSFVTIFVDTRNVNLIKDVGQIPYFMFKDQGYQATLVTYRNDAAYPYLDKEVKGLAMRFLERSGKIFGAEIAVIRYLLAEAKSIDVLHLFHFKKRNLFYLAIYRLLNPKGKTYLKFDLDLQSFRKYNTWFHSRYYLKNGLLKLATKLHFRLTNLFSVETRESMDHILKLFPELKEKLIYSPNGIDDTYISDSIRINTFEEKEKLLITVGRVGAEQKNTEILLDALAFADLKDWKVCIIGPIEESFHTYIDEFYKKNQRLKEKVVFTGNISDRRELYELYNKASIFCLTSRREGFPLTFSEAAYFGNYIITTPVSAAFDITGTGRYGVVVNDRRELSLAIENSIADGFLTEKLCNDIRNHAKSNFTWPAIIRNISQHLNS